MSAEILSDRRFLTGTFPQSLEDEPKDGCLPPNIRHGTNVNGTSVLYLPAVVYGFMSELIKVDVSQKQVQCKFSIFVTVKLNLNEKIMADLRKKQISKKSEDQKQPYIKNELAKLTHFLKNNLIVQCGDKVIDIVNAEGKNQELQGKDEKNELETDSEDEESQDEEDCFWIKMPNLNKQNSVTYKIVGTFKCSYELYNLFFPYHHINSSLCVKVRQQYFNHMVIRYDLFDMADDSRRENNQIISDTYKQQNQFEIKQFSLKFTESSHRRFGNYRINCCPGTYKTKSVTEGLQDILNAESFPLSAIPTNFQDYKVIHKTLFQFQIYSYNVPFMLRYIIPLLVLCFASLMVYFADSTQISNTFGNVILIGITLIQQLSNFRTSKYDTTNLNFYQATILGIVLINFLLVIITTKNFYALTDASLDQKRQANANSPVFWVAVGIAGFCLLVNMAIMIFFKYKVAYSYSWEAQKEKEEKQWNHFWVWNQQLVGSIENQITFGEGPNIIGIRRTVSPLI